MSAHALPDHAPAGHADAGHSAPHESKFYLFVQIALFLAIITGSELVMVFLPFPFWVVCGTLVVLSLVKFMLVIFFFMHLRWDKAFCTVLFFIGLILAGGTMWALLRLFGEADSKPLSSARANPPAQVQSHNMSQFA